MIVLLALSVALPAEAVRSESAPPQTVLVGLPDAGAKALRIELERIAPGRFAIVSWNLGSGTQLPSGSSSPGDVVALFGYPLPDLLAIGAATPFEPIVGVDPHPLDAQDGSYRVLFADPLVAVIDEETVKRELASSVADVLPREPEELCRARFSGRFFCVPPAAGNILGAFFGRLAVANESSIDDLLVGFGGNVESSAISNAAAAIARIREEEAPAFAILTRSEFAAHATEAPGMSAIPVFGSSIAVIRGVALPKGHTEFSSVLSALFSADGDALGRIGKAIEQTPLRGARSAGLDETALAVRRAMEFEAPRIVREQEEARTVVARFDSGLKDRLKRRRERFEDVYDVVALIAIAAFVGYMLVKRRPREGAAAR